MCESYEEALVDLHFQQLIREGCVRLGNEGTDLSSYIQPASLDIPLTSRCYLVKDKILPFGTTIGDVLSEIMLEEMTLPSLSDDKLGPIFFKGHTYLAYCGVVKLPADMRASLSPKSSIGRIDVMVRAVIDNCGFYDTIERGSTGELWMEISPRSFNIRLCAGLSLSQMMVFQECKQTDQEKNYLFPILHTTHNLVYDSTGTALPIKLHNHALILSLNVPSSDILGFEALPTNEIIDLSKIGQLDATRFFRPLTLGVPFCGENNDSLGSAFAKKGKRTQTSVTLEKDKFYVLATKERVSVPYDLSAEMVPFSQHIGELRAHYAGFFDPGFGFSADGTINGTIGVLEVRPHETIRVYDGQPIALMEFFRNKCDPNVPYGKANNHYQHQAGPKLSKYFREEHPTSEAELSAPKRTDLKRSRETVVLLD